jgi:hypothetical protein
MRLMALAVLLVGAVLGIQVAAGGGDYVPARPADPCVTRSHAPVAAHLEALAERLVLSGLDETACARGVSRERLVLALAEGDAVDADALRAGLERGVDRAGPLPPVSALLGEALDLSDLPGLAQDAIERIPDGVVDRLLPTRALLRRAIGALDVDAVLGDLDDPSRLEPVLRDAILRAARDQVISALPDF